MRNIYLIGMMGAGKTAAGKALAQMARMDFIDLDEVIESETRLSINEMFEKKGEPFFRMEERRALEESSKLTNTVIATGGGIVLDPRNVERMAQTGQVIYLAARFETLWERVRDKKDRPLLKAADPRATLYRLYEIRRPFYESVGHRTVATDQLQPEEVARKIFDQCLQSP